MLTPDERLPYYEALWQRWYDDDPLLKVPLTVMQAACLYEREDTPGIPVEVQEAWKTERANELAQILSERNLT